MQTLTPFMLDRLHKRELNQQKRKLPKRDWAYDFSSNDYISFARSSLLRERIVQQLAEVDCIGASGSRLLTGNMPLAEEVEQSVAKFFGFPKALIFPCGFTLNCGLLASLSNEDDSIIMDENVHASMKNGLKLAAAHGYFFRHNDLNRLESRLRKEHAKKRNIFVVVEALYSMDGDSVDLPALLGLCERYEARLIIDEAHSAGSMGDTGRGLVAHHRAQDRVFGNVVTFGKAFGYHGAALLGSEELISYVVNFCHSFIYTTGLSSFSLIAMRESLKLFEENPNPFLKLHENIKQFNKELGLSHNTPIYSFPFTDLAQLREAAHHLQSQGFGILPIYSPTVRKGCERLRVSIHAHNSESELTSCARKLKDFL
jgi:8-amino-7-oxononanoate synthase